MSNRDFKINFHFVAFHFENEFISKKFCSFSFSCSTNYTTPCISIHNYARFIFVPLVSPVIRTYDLQGPQEAAYKGGVVQFWRSFQQKHNVSKTEICIHCIQIARKGKVRYIGTNKLRVLINRFEVLVNSCKFLSCKFFSLFVNNTVEGRRGRVFWKNYQLYAVVFVIINIVPSFIWWNLIFEIDFF